MTLPAGSRLGPYEILAPIGAGGMGDLEASRKFVEQQPTETPILVGFKR